MTRARKEQISFLRTIWSVYTYTATAGTTSTVLPGGFQSSSLTQTSGGNGSSTPLVRGIVTAGTANFVRMRLTADASALTDGDAVITGRLTYSGGNYTISYKTTSGGAEIAATLPGSGTYSVDILYPEVAYFYEISGKEELYLGIYESFSAGGGSGSSLTAANITAMSALDDSDLDNGSSAYILSVGDYFILDKTSTLTADAITVAVTLSGTGRWIRQNASSIKWVNQATWYINASSGNDENSGVSSGAALQTHDEFMRRISRHTITQTIDVFIVGNYTDDVNINVTFDNDTLVFLNYWGVITPIFTSTFTGVTNYNAASQQEDIVTDTAIPTSWTASSLVNKLIRVTSGTGAGAYAAVAKDLGTKQARISRWYDVLNFTEMTVGIGDTYEVYTVNKFGGTVVLDVKGVGQVYFSDLDLATTDVTHGVNAIRGTSFMIGCHLNGLDIESTAEQVGLIACRIKNGCRTNGSNIIMDACLAVRDTTAAIQSRENGRIFINTATMCQGTGGVSVDPRGFISVDEPLAIFDCTTAMTVGNSGVLELNDYLWGKGVSTTGIDVKANGAVSYDPAKVPAWVSSAPTNYVLSGGVSVASTEIPFFNLAKNAAIVEK